MTSERKPWFKPNAAGPGFHPSRWETWVILVVVVAAIVSVIVLLRTGVL